MRLFITPLLLCLFATFSVVSNTINTEDSLENNLQLNSPLHGIIVEYQNSILSNFTSNNFQNIKSNNSINNSVFLFNSSFSNSNGIPNNYDFSYNNLTNNGKNFTPIYIHGGFFSQGLFYGFSMTIILLNLLCFFIFNEKLYLIFSSTVAALTTTYFYAEGLFTLLGINGLLKNELILSSLLALTVGIGILFANEYLSIKEFYPKLSRVTIPLFGITIILISFAWVTKDSSISNFANLMLYGLLSLYFIVGVLLFSKKNYAKFYVISTFIPLLFSIDFFVLKPFGIDFLFTEAIHLKIATVFEVLILSYAIMYRMKAVKEEGELRQTEMRIFLKRQDIMSRTQVEQLVEDVYLENLIMQYDLDGLEIKLLQYISEGKTNTKIARKLKLTEPEVVDFTKELYQKLEISEHIKEDHRMVDSQPDYIYN